MAISKCYRWSALFQGYFKELWYFNITLAPLNGFDDGEIDVFRQVLLRQAAENPEIVKDAIKLAGTNNSSSRFRDCAVLYGGICTICSLYWSIQYFSSIRLDIAAMKKDVAEIKNHINARFEAYDARFEAYNARFDAENARFDRMLLGTVFMTTGVPVAMGVAVVLKNLIEK